MRGELRAGLVVLAALLVSCQTTPAGSKTGALRSLLRGASRVEVQTWDEGQENERKVTVYSFTPETKDRLLEAVNAEFYQIRSGEYTRDWGLPGGVLRWCVPADTAKWDRELHFSAAGETRVYTYQFQPIPEGGLVTWTAVTGTEFGQNQNAENKFYLESVSGLAYGGGKFVAGGNDGKIAYSNSQE